MNVVEFPCSLPFVSDNGSKVGFGGCVRLRQGLQKEEEGVTNRWWGGYEREKSPNSARADPFGVNKSSLIHQCPMEQIGDLVIFRHAV